jgi:hypothetical protein
MLSTQYASAEAYTLKGENLPKNKKWTVYFDIACMIDVDAQSEEDALQKAKDNISKAEEGEAHSFRANEQ